MALSPDVENDGGKYFQNCSKFRTNSQVNNKEVQQSLWVASCKATGWEDTFSSTIKPKGSPVRKMPSIVITKDNGNESKNKVTKDDLEKEGDRDNGNKINVKVNENSAGSSSGADAANSIPTAVGGNE